MSQHDFEIANQGFPSFRSDLNSGLQALASNSAGATEPSSTYAYQFWYDSTANLLKMRNADDDAWITLAYFDQTNDEWEVRSAVIQAVDSAGVTIKTDDGVARITVADNGNVTIANDVTITGELVKSGAAHIFNRTSSDGDIVSFEKDGTTVGSIGTDTLSNAGTYIGTGDVGMFFHTSAGGIVPYDTSTQSETNGTIDLGRGANRFKRVLVNEGISLNSTATTLDDYEEGTFEVTLNLSSGSASFDSASNTLAYSKIGNTVFFHGNVDCNSVSSPAGSMTITGLPFAIADLTDKAGRSNVSIWISNTSQTVNSFVAQLVEGGADIKVYQGTSAGITTNIGNVLSGNEEFSISGFYRTS